MMLDPVFHEECKRWMAQQVNGLTHTIERLSPSQHSERYRYLPGSVTSKPGYLRFSTTPYMREIADCFDIRSPIREVNLMKGVQIGYTTILETILFYVMEHIKTQPCMFMTADAELAKARIENSITPMLVMSGKYDIIQSSDPMNSRKTGKTDKHIQWKGGGYMVPFGANNANKMRTFSIQWMLKDELDAWADVVGHDGEPDALSDARCSAFWERRKIFRGSTPLEAHRSKIYAQFLRGDQRYYYVCCLHCNFAQVLRWDGVNKQNGITYGIKWELDGGQLVQESVHYVCRECGHKHYEYDKTRLFAAENGAEWRPTAKPALKDIRSYHLSALYSPDGFQPWYKCVASYLAGWDPEKKMIRDSGKYQEFYNNVLGQVYRVLGDRLTFATVSSLRRGIYALGEIPNDHAEQYAGGKIQMVVLTVDMHKSNLAVAAFGFTPTKTAYLLDYWRFKGDALDAMNPDTWGEVRKLIEARTYTDYEGNTYPVALTLIDASYSTGIVNEFCAQYVNQSVYPIMGREEPPKHAANRQFWPFQTKAGITGYGIIVDSYKDTISMALRRYWDGNELQPPGYFNAPANTPDEVIRELTAETRREKIDPLTNKVIGAEWHRPSGADNELFDLLVYARCGLDMCGWDIWYSEHHLARDKKTVVDWKQVFDYIAEQKVYYLPGEPNSAAA